MKQPPKEELMNHPGTWPAWQPQPAADDPTQGGMTQLAAYDAGLTDDPGCWTQKVELHQSPRLDPESCEYDPEYAARVAWEEPSPAEQRALDELRRQYPEPPARPGPEAQSEPELPF
jgi:hypothetical protein